MILDKYLARELGCPTGILSAFFLPRVWNVRNTALNERVLEMLWLLDNDRVLEVGFGGGYLLGRMVELVRLGIVVGVDASPAMVEHCRRKYQASVSSHRLDLRCSTAEALPFESETFTKVCTVNTVFFWQDPHRVIAEIHKILTPGGVLVIGLTAPESLRKKGFARHGLTLLGGSELKEVMEEAGFERVIVEHDRDSHRELQCARGEKVGS